MLGYARAGGMASLAQAAPRLLFLLGADEMDFAPFAGSFKVYVGHHGDRGAAAADVVLPAAAYSEKPGIHVNLEGRVQYSEKAVDPPGDAREDWSIFRALSDALGHKLPFDSFHQLREQLFAADPRFAQPGLVTFDWSPPALDPVAIPSGTALAYPIQDYYLTNPSPAPRRPAALLGRDPPRPGLSGGGGIIWVWSTQTWSSRMSIARSWSRCR
jgi:NADH-quinone oxidoreductase subunit G